ncbi:hypothetical protein CEXT_6821 [Caerostris extrusa]|uniref:Uncharacterized protein n=1 Tax=Caerostris extrusa TaxID=172846 RepID=A0AAV4XKA4_CAEEX|nr:hypothetical protein CEXT_6821 [Caerostris extrusa]
MFADMQRMWKQNVFQKTEQLKANHERSKGRQCDRQISGSTDEQIECRILGGREPMATKGDPLLLRPSPFPPSPETSVTCSTISCSLL